ncbi:MAG: hypothetical protein GYB65_20325 [Chloroflexi bacterium]|nr:hypothetical protein [Chloroflexota bacterium]
MSGLYDQLMDQLGDDDDNDKPVGITPLDIAGLTEPQRSIMFWLLRDKESSSSSDGVALAAVEARFGDVENLPGVLDELEKNNWLIVMGEPPTVRYKINLRRKRGSKLAATVWESLSDRLSDDDSEDANNNDDDPSANDSNPGVSALLDW